MANSSVTIADIVQIAYVSKMSVSRVLNGQSGVSEQTRQRILEVIEQTGYVPNSGPNLRPVGSKLVALLVPDITTTYMGKSCVGFLGQRNG